MIARVFTAAACSLATSVALADPRPAVSIVMAGAESARAPTETALRELLGRLDVEVRVASTAEVVPSVVLAQGARRELVARVWVDLTRADRARFYLVDADGARVYVRTFPLPQGFDEVARETLAHVVEDAVDALLHGARIGVAREALPEFVRAPVVEAPPPATPARHPTAQRTSRIHFGAACEAQWRGDATAHGPSIHAGVSLPLGSLRIGGRLAFQYRVPATVETAEVSLRLDELSLRALATLEHPLGRRLSFAFAAGAGVVLVTISPHANDPRRVVADPPSLRALPVARTQAELHVRLNDRVRVWGALTLEAELSGARYFIDRGGARDFIASPWALRLGAALGVEARF